MPRQTVKPVISRVYAASGITQVTVSPDQGGCGHMHKMGKKDERFVIDCVPCATALAPAPIPQAWRKVAADGGMEQVNFSTDPKDPRLLTTDEWEEIARKKEEANLANAAAGAALAKLVHDNLPRA